jgi:hypothetical protein
MMRRKKGRGISPTLNGQSLDKVGHAVGMDRKTVQQQHYDTSVAHLRHLPHFLR